MRKVQGSIFATKKQARTVIVLLIRVEIALWGLFCPLAKLLSYLPSSISKMPFPYFKTIHMYLPHPVTPQCPAGCCVYHQFSINVC
jgi:hypothetical protein